MNRRDYLAVFGTSVLPVTAGCTSNSTNSGGAKKTRQNQNQDSYREVGTSFETSTQITIEIDDVRLANSVEHASDGEIETRTGQMFVLAHVSTKNKGSEPNRLPSPSSFALVSGSSQYNHYREERILRDGQLTAPVEADLYTGLTDARPQVANEGWLFFAVPKDTEQVTLAWSGNGELSEEESYWKTTVDSATLPNITLKGIDAPESVRLGKQFTVTILVENTGGSTGTISTKYTLTTPSNHSEDRALEREIPAGETVEETIEVRPQALGKISVTIVELQASATVLIEPARRQIGELFHLPDGPRISISNLVFSDSFTYESYDGSKTISADSGKQFLFAKFRAENPTDTAQMIPGVKRITASINGNTHDIAYVEKSVTQDFVSPVSGSHYFQTFTPLSAGKTTEGWLVFQIPKDETKADLTIKAKWPVDGRQKAAVYWVQSE